MREVRKRRSYQMDVEQLVDDRMLSAAEKGGKRCGMKQAVDQQTGGRV